MQRRNTLVFLKKVNRAQRDILRTDQLLTCLYEMTDSRQSLLNRMPNAQRYQNLSMEEPLWFITFGTVISAFLPALLIVWSYHYMRFESVEYIQIPSIIGISVVIALLCGIIRLCAAWFTRLDAKGTSSLKKFISAAEYTKSLAQNAVCRALDVMELPEEYRKSDALSGIYRYLIHSKDSTLETALTSYEYQAPPVPKPIRPAPAPIYFCLRRARKNADRLIRMSC